MGKKRFDVLMEKTYKKDIRKFLNEYEYAFAKWLMERDDEPAFKRYSFLAFAIYFADKWGMKDYPGFFKSIIDVFIAQLNYIESSALTEESEFIRNYKYFIEELRDTGQDDLVKKADEFSKYLSQRGLPV